MASSLAAHSARKARPCGCVVVCWQGLELHSIPHHSLPRPAFTNTALRHCLTTKTVPSKGCSIPRLAELQYQPFVGAIPPMPHPQDETMSMHLAGTLEKEVLHGGLIHFGQKRNYFSCLKHNANSRMEKIQAKRNAPVGLNPIAGFAVLAHLGFVAPFVHSIMLHGGYTAWAVDLRLQHCFHKVSHFSRKSQRIHDTILKI